MVFSKEATQPPPAKRQRLGAVALDSEGRTLSEYRQQAKDTNAAHNHGVKYSFLNNIRDQKGRKPEDKEYALPPILQESKKCKIVNFFLTKFLPKILSVNVSFSIIG